MALHSRGGCSIVNTNDFSGHIQYYNCDVNAPGQPTNAGCNIKSDLPLTYGTSFNSGGGGVYAMEWTSSSIRIWYFRRTHVPSDIINGNPNPNSWPTPISKFAGCDFDRYFDSHIITFDMTFCGDWAGNVWSSDGACASRASSCTDFVQNNPQEFKETYWLINSLKVYQN